VAYLNQEWLNKACSPIIMQYTGLHDKLGKEIYEGDILRIEGIVPLRAGFINGCFVEDNIMPPEPLGICLLRYKKEHGDCEVIGNIYENPELLKEKSS
jgi:uncharacterized phage protein (TIGR01671 family)